MKTSLSHFAITRLISSIMFFIFLTFSCISSASAGTYCPYGAIYQGENNKNATIELTINRIGFVHLPREQGGKKFPAFALEITLVDNTTHYGWGFIRSYVFLTNRQYLDSNNVEWQSRTEHSDGDFFRFMQENGGDMYFSLTSSRCK